MKKAYLAVLAGVVAVGAGIALSYTQEDAVNTENTCEAGEFLFKHKDWTDCMIIDGEYIYRKSNQDKALFSNDGNTYLLHWPSWNTIETFVCHNNVCPMLVPKDF